MNIISEKFSKFIIFNDLIVDVINFEFQQDSLGLFKRIVFSYLNVVFLIGSRSQYVLQLLALTRLFEWLQL